MRSHQPYSCIKEYRIDKSVHSDPFLDIHSLGVILLEILVGTDVILSCGCWDNVVDLIKVCEDYIDADTSKLLHSLIGSSLDSKLETCFEEILHIQPGLIAENIRALDFAVKENRFLIDK